jgi:ArsR family transcriptional regulator, arsenate/arsenite/antimonite-responsive transcriptional repressor
MDVDMTSANLPISCCGPLAAPRLSNDEVDATAALFRALGDPARVRILNVVATRTEPVCICELTVPLGLAQPTVSHHVRKLVDAGLLDREQRGKWAYLSLRPDAVSRLASLTDLKGATRADAA